MAEAQIAHEELQKLVDTPVGPLRVNMPADFGTDFLAESFMEFSLRYPDVTFYLDLANPDHAQRVFQTCDVSIEIGELPDSTQIARLHAAASSVRVARVPGKHGEPKHPSDLTRHECIEFRAEGAGRVTRWPLNNGDQHIEFTPGNRFSVNGVAMARRLAMLGAGIAVLVGGQREEQRSGQLRVLPDWQLGPFPVYAVTETRLLPAKTRIFIEFLMERLGSGPTRIAPLS